MMRSIYKCLCRLRIVSVLCGWLSVVDAAPSFVRFSGCQRQSGSSAVRCFFCENLCRFELKIIFRHLYTRAHNHVIVRKTSMVFVVNGREHLRTLTVVLAVACWL